MEKTLIKNNVKKDISLILCVIYFSYLIFKIFVFFISFNEVIKNWSTK